MAKLSLLYLDAASRCLGLSSPCAAVRSTFKMSRVRSTPAPSSVTSNLAPSSRPMSTAADMPAPSEDDSFNPRFLVISLGNPPPHADSLHSAGHIALQSLQQRLNDGASSHAQPKFASERVAKKATQTSRGPKYTLLQCPTLMNVSGPWVTKAWREVLAESKEQHPDRPLGLVIVHDDLEEDMCVVKVRKWDRSHRGHNGLKSIMAQMRQADHKDCKWAKVSLGIGRPEGRDHDTVSDYVLRPLSKYQRSTLSENSASPILAALHQIEAAWRSETDNDTTNQPQIANKAANRGKKGAHPEATTYV